MQAVVREPAFEWERFSSFEQMIRLLSHCLRLKKRKSEGILTVEELNTTKLAILLSEGKFPGGLREDLKTAASVVFRSIEQIVAVSGQKLVATTTRPVAAFKVKICSQTSNIIVSKALCCQQVD